MVTNTPSGSRAVARCDLLGSARYSDAPDRLFRPYLGPAHQATLEAVAGWMADAGMTHWIDPAGNLIGRYEGAEPGAPALLIGSHIDSVRDAGRYDGPLGVMLGIEVVASLSTAGKRLPFAIEVIAFGDEEGSRFPASMLCSRAIAGTLDPAMLEVADADGVSLGEALARFGLDKARFVEAKRDPGSVIAFLEAHIEQGPVLEAEGLALGIVTGIAAQLRFQAHYEGQAGHAGTSAMPLRKDALAAAAEAVLAAERIAKAGPPDLVATVGRMTVSPGAVNVVPGQVDFSIDIRSGDRQVRDDAAARILAALNDIAMARGIVFRADRVQDLPASPCDAELMDHLAHAVRTIGLPERRLVSGAGHDSMAMAALAPTAMLFLRCAGGVSHNPAERVDSADADLALAAMLGFVERLGEEG